MKTRIIGDSISLDEYREAINKIEPLVEELKIKYCQPNKSWLD